MTPKPQPTLKDKIVEAAEWLAKAGEKTRIAEEKIKDAISAKAEARKDLQLAEQNWASVKNELY